MPEIKEVKDQLDILVKGVTDLQGKQTEFEKNSGETSAKTNGEIETLKKTVVDTVELMQKARTEDAAIIQQQKDDLALLQKEIISGMGGNKDAVAEAYKKYDNHLAAFLKRGEAIPAEDVTQICRDIATKQVFGMNDEYIDREAKDLVSGSNVAGGFFLQPDRSSSMSTRIFETSNLRPLVSVETTNTGMWEMVLDDGETDSGWVGEVDARPKTNTAEIGLLQIPIHELYAKPRATQTQLDDAGFDIVAWHQAKVTKEFGRKENTAGVIGDGAKKWKGFLSYAAWAAAGVYERNAVEQVTTSTATTILADDLIGLQGTLLEPYQAGAQFAMARLTFYNNILTLKDDSGAYLINPRLIAEGGQMVLLGKPVNLFSDMPVVADNSLSVAYANWSDFYVIVDRFGIRVLRNPYIEAPYTQFYTTKRSGAAVKNYEAGKILKTLSS